MSLPNIPEEDLKSTIARALQDVFDTMLGLSCEPGESVDYSGLKPEVPSLGADDASLIYVGSVGFVGKLNGMVYLYMKSEFAEHAAQRITGLDADEMDFEIISDVCGELTNMFGGSFKNTLADLGYESTLTIPTVLSGDELFISTLGVKKHIRIDFSAGEDQVSADLVLADPQTVELV
ncbi:MAG: chemotaxis protein CheX [Verrucomicrobiota bacterium]